MEPSPGAEMLTGETGNETAMLKLKLILAGLVVAVLVAGDGAIAGPLEDAAAADERGDCAKALKLLTTLAEQGNALAEARLGLMHEHGCHVANPGIRDPRLPVDPDLPPDDIEAMKWYLLSAEQGFGPAQVVVGMAYLYGTSGVREDDVLAYMWFSLAAAQGNKDAAQIRDLFARGMKPDQITEAQRLAREWKPKARPLEDAEGAYGRGDYATALKLWTPLADHGNAFAQVRLGVMYEKGQGVPQDDAEAVKWYRLAADQGDATGQVRLGLAYVTGRGVPQDDAEAVKWYRLAADQGDATGQVRLGLAYVTGKGVPRDDAEAVKWYHLAAEQGDATGRHTLDAMYDLGQGAPENYQAERSKTIRRAADQGNAKAQYSLGLAYTLGRGVPKDDVLAYMWFSLAAAQGDNDAADMRDEDALGMKPDQIAEAQRLAREWKPKPQP